MRRLLRRSSRNSVKCLEEEENQEETSSVRFSNFRWILKLGFAKRSSQVLTENESISVDLQRSLSDIGCFADIAHNFFNVRLIWLYLDSLLQHHFPLELYQGLRGSDLHSVIHGTESTRAIIVHLPKKRQAVLAFAGTAYVEQALLDLDIRKTIHKSICNMQEDSSNVAYVHSGFWKLYLGIRSYVFGALTSCLLDFPEIEEIVITGHSLGAALACFFVLDLIGILEQTMTTPTGRIFTIKYVGFGSPRVGDSKFAEKYAICVDKYKRKFGETTFVDFSVRNYNDGIPALPPMFLGYRHPQLQSLYEHQGRIYRIPETEKEHNIFTVRHDENHVESTQRHRKINSRGGHKFYNGRDLDRTCKLMCRLDYILVNGTPVDGWEEKYLVHYGPKV